MNGATGEGWEVQVVDEGRECRVVYREPGHELRFWWEYGGGDAVALIRVGTADEWEKSYPWASGRRGEIVARITDALIRQQAPSCIGTLDDRGWITLSPRGGSAPRSEGSTAGTRPGGAGPSGATTTGAAVRPLSPAEHHFAVSRRKASIVGIAAIVIVVLSTIAWLGRSALQVRTTGSPVGRSMRSGTTIVTLVSRLEPYVPALHRDASKDRYTIGLLLHNVRSGERRYIELGGGRDGSSSVNVKLEAVDGARVWVQTPPTMLVDLSSGRVFSSEELDRDPSLAPPNRPFRMSDLARGDDAIERMLSPTETTGDAVYRPAFVRSEIDGPPLSLVGGGRLHLHETARYRTGTVVASRAGTNGEAEWTVDTGIGKLLDILPDPEWPALIGERPRVPDKVPEPILVTIDARTGKARTHSLWVQ